MVLYKSTLVVLTAKKVQHTGILHTCRTFQTTSKAQMPQALTLIPILGAILSGSKWSEAY